MEPNTNPDNKPVFDGNTWLAIALTFGFFVFWQNYIKRNYPDSSSTPKTQQQASKTKADTGLQGSRRQGTNPQGAGAPVSKGEKVGFKDGASPVASNVSNGTADQAFMGVGGHGGAGAKSLLDEQVKPVNLTRLNFPETFSLDLTEDGMGFRNIVLNKYKDRTGKEIGFHSNTQQWQSYFSTQREGSGKDQESNQNLDSGASAVPLSADIRKLEKAPLFGTTVDGQTLTFDVKKQGANIYQGTALFLGGTLKKRIEIFPASYSAVVDIDVQWEGRGARPVIETRFFDSIKSESASMFRPSYEGSDFFTLSSDGESRERQTLGADFQESKSAVSLSAITSQYFALAVLDQSDMMPSVDNKLLGKEAGVAVSRLLHEAGSRETTKIRYKVFFGPKDRDILIAVDPKLEKVIDYGFFSFIAKPILQLLKLLYSLLGNWGGAIVLLTLGIRLLLLPIALSSMRSMKKMQKIQPMLKQIKEKFKDNPQQANLETIALMKREGANPISGCLPMFAQIPIFFALYSVLGVAIELYQSPFFLWIDDLSWKDPFYILPVLVTGLFFLQTKMSPSSMDENQKKMMAFMPIVFGIFTFSLPAGLMVYFLTNNIFGIGQQYYVNKEKKAA